MIKKNYKIIDQLRGLAFILMIVHHIHYFYDVGNNYITNTARSSIVETSGTISRSLFILLVGVSLYHNYSKIRKKNNKSECKQKFIYERLNKTIKILLHALIITGITCMLYPNYPIYFGVLHSIALGSLISIIFVDKPTIGFLVAIIMTIFSNEIKQKISDVNLYSGIHTILGTNNYHMAIDYFPLLKWLPLLLLGIFIGYLQENPEGELLDELGSYKKNFNQILTFFGKNSLNIYTAHLIFLLYYYRNGYKKLSFM